MTNSGSVPEPNPVSHYTVYATFPACLATSEECSSLWSEILHGLYPTDFLAADLKLINWLALGTDQIKF